MAQSVPTGVSQAFGLLLTSLQSTSRTVHFSPLQLTLDPPPPILVDLDAAAVAADVDAGDPKEVDLDAAAVAADE